VASPRIAAVVGVCDEVELIAKCIRHLQRSGVTSIVVVDNNSNDGTERILDSYAEAGQIELLRTSADPMKGMEYFLSEFLRGVDLARSRFSPDWLLLQDADEFWVHHSGDLNEIVRDAKDDVLLLDRFNACLSKPLQRKIEDADQPRFEELDIFVQPLRLSRTMMDANSTLRWISARPAEKVIARAGVVAAISAGGHHVIGQDGNTIPSRRVAGAAIVHIPFSTEERFRRKIENVASLFDRNPALFSGNLAWHWRRWVEIYRKGE
jgi:glycosyltransferase involved in cell wall biosynthesis